VEKLGVIIGIAVAVAIVVFLRDRRDAQGQRLRAAAIGLVVGGVAAAAAVYGLAALREGGEEAASIDQAMASARALPMVGVVLDDVPGSEGLLRAAFK
jgi:hypothetical protein